MQNIIKAKWITYRDLTKCRNEINLEKYNLVRKEAKKAVCEAKHKACENLRETRKKSKREGYV